MLDEGLLAKLGVARIRTPLPTAKMAIVHAAAGLLRLEDSASVTWNALLDWIAGLELESEVAEGLCIAVLAKDAAVVSVPDLQRSIRRPSVLSDLFFAQLTGHPVLFNAWLRAHSGPTRPFFQSKSILDDLEAGYTVPPILYHAFLDLEETSGRPLLSHWAYECERLEQRLGRQSDGQPSYFQEHSRDETDRGPFIARRGHVARSAYLRTLAYACEAWGMPEDVARTRALVAGPVDFHLLPMIPCSPPPWANALYGAQPSDQQSLQHTVDQLVDRIAQERDPRTIGYLDTALPYGPRYRADIQITTALETGATCTASDIFRALDRLPGAVEIPRTRRSFDLRKTNQIAAIENAKGGLALPAVLPCLGSSIGYFHADLIERIPYLPANYSLDQPVMATPRKGGADVTIGDTKVGELSYWSVAWRPTHDARLGPRCAVSLTMDPEQFKAMLQVPGARIRLAWRAKVLSRNDDYGSFEIRNLEGFVD